MVLHIAFSTYSHRSLIDLLWSQVLESVAANTVSKDASPYNDNAYVDDEPFHDEPFHDEPQSHNVTRRRRPWRPWSRRPWSRRPYWRNAWRKCWAHWNASMFSKISRNNILGFIFYFGKLA